ncbi:MAG: RNA methyltransferase [Oscillospiraceae bacterium]|nr:RNA methyltransferase [Oscillospiraceae bacterium]
MDEIKSRRNPLAQHFRRLGADSGYREQCGEFICDGLKLLEEAAACGAEITTAFAVSPLPVPLPAGARVFGVHKTLLDYISPLKSAQDTIFSCRKPPQGGFSDLQGSYVLLDGIQDPGNLGTIVRTAHAFGMQGVILTGNCADPYNPRAVRATMGAIFKQSIFTADISHLAAMKTEGLRFIGTSSGAQSGRGLNGLKPAGSGARGVAICIGSEGNGLSREVTELCDDVVSIPMAEGCESLNAAVAAAILMWELRKCHH